MGIKRLGLALSLVLCGLGTFWAFTKGGADFKVFYQVWRTVLEGNYLRVYGAAQDRFLYAPGFAWLFAPLGFFSESVALAIWCILKTLALLSLLNLLAKKLHSPWAVWGAVFMARPLLIDFQYGQVNTFIMVACTAFLLASVDLKPRRYKKVKAFALGFCASVAAFAKLVILPVLVVPFLSVKRASFHLRFGIILGLWVILFIPLIHVNPTDFGQLYLFWKEAIISRSLPTESHNQSFAAFILHFFTAAKTHVISLGPPPGTRLGYDLLPETFIPWIASLWGGIWIAVTVVWIVRPPCQRSVGWVAVLTALLVVPSHLVWKPYFVMTIPLACVALSQNRKFSKTLFCIFILVNFTGFDVLGYWLSARLEAASLLLWLHLWILGLVVPKLPKKVAI